MHWRRVDPVQQVGALLLTGADACDAALVDLARRKGHFSHLDVVTGSGWLALVPSAAITVGTPPRDLVLPFWTGATSLYYRLQDVWLAVGWECGVPPHVEPTLLRSMLARDSIASAVIVVPSAGTAQTTRCADLYVLEGRRSVADLKMNDAVQQ